MQELNQHVINHEPLFDTAKVEEHYSKKDGVDVKYVCTSALGTEEYAYDIFFRETPHPQFGNRYFGLIRRGDTMLITNADAIDNQTFSMFIDNKGKYHYSKHRWDYNVKDGKFVDGGRAYARTNTMLHDLKLVDGKFYYDDSNGTDERSNQD